MGTGSKVLSVFLRLGELSSSVIVTALISRFFWLLSQAPDDHPIEGRLTYTEVISCLQIIFSIILIFPAKYSFYSWPLDVVWFICGIVAFGLLAALNAGCSSFWYWSYWGYYWGRFWTITPLGDFTFGDVNGAGCSSWRVILAFLFVGAMCWFLSAILGFFVFLEMRAGRETNRTAAMKEKVLRRKHHESAPSDPDVQQA